MHGPADPQVSSCAPCDHPVTKLVKRINVKRSRMLPGLWCDDCGAHLKYANRVADGLVPFDNPKAIPVPPRRVVHVRSNDTTNKRNVVALAVSGGFEFKFVGVKP